MTVAELEDLLARLPADMPVLVGGSGPGLFHVGQIKKASAHYFKHFGHHAPPSLHLVAGYPPKLWFEDEPAVEVRGRWPKVRSGGSTEETSP